MKKLFILLILVIVQASFLYSCNPHSAQEEDSLYTFSLRTGDDDDDNNKQEPVVNDSIPNSNMGG